MKLVKREQMYFVIRFDVELYLLAGKGADSGRTSISMLGLTRS